MDELSPLEKKNLDAYSTKEGVADYERTGFYVLEEYTIDTYFTEGKKILDIGCGAGRTTYSFNEKGYDVIGIDYAPAMIEKAKELHPNIDFRVMNACALDFEDETFDHVYFSFNGIDHIHPFPKRVDCLKEIYRVLKKGGTFAYNSHNALCLPKDRITLSLYVRNLLSLRLFTGYRISFQSSGTIYLCYVNPFRERGRLKKAGFTFIENPVKPGRNKNQLIRMLRDLSVHYVARKD